MMNTLYKSLTIAFLAASIFISGLNVDFVGAQDTAAGSAASRRSDDPLLSRYLRFDRLTADDGLSSFEDRSGNLWLGTEGGLDKLNPERTRITSYLHDANDPQTLSHIIIDSGLEDRSRGLWIGTWGGGLNQYDREKDALIRYQNDPDDPHSLIGGNVDLIYEGRHGMLWIAWEAV
jgi:ligand-binding sensor domain-containing protein